MMLCRFVFFENMCLYYANILVYEFIYLFLFSGNIGTELSSTNLGMFITSDAGNSWRQVRPICASNWAPTSGSFVQNLHFECEQLLM